MEDQIFYLIKDHGLSTVIAVASLGIFYKFGNRVLAALMKSNEIIERNTRIIEQNTKIISVLIDKLATRRK